MPTPKNSEPNSRQPAQGFSSKVDDPFEGEPLFQYLTEDFKGNPEERLRWQAHCRAALESADKDFVQETSARISKSQSRKGFLAGIPLNWPLLFIPLAIGVLALVNQFHLHVYQLGLYPLKGEHAFVHGIYGGDIPSKQAQKRLTEEELLLVFGRNSSIQTEPAPLPLHQRYPDDLHYLSDYLASNKAASEKDFERAMVLDPDNGYFPLFYAGHLVEQSLERNPLYSSHKQQLPRRFITDPENLERALSLMALASQKTRFVRPSNELQRKRVSFLPAPKTISEEADHLAALYGNPTEDIFNLLDLANGVVTKADLLAQQEDQDSLEELTYAALKFVPHSLATTPSSLGSAAHHLYLRQISKPLATHSKENNLHQLAAELDALNSQIETLLIWKKSKPNVGVTASKNGWPLLELAASSYEGIANVTQPTVQDYEPGRMKWHLNVERTSLAILAGFFVSFAVLFFLLSYLRKKPTRDILPRFANLISLPQQLFILSSSFLLPLICYLAVTRLTPLGCLDWSFHYAAGQPHNSHLLSGATLFIVFSIALTSNVVRRQLSRLRLAHPTGWLDWIPTILVGLTLLTAGMIRYFPQFHIRFSIALGALGVLFLFVLTSSRILNSQGGFLVRYLSARTLAINFSGLAILLTALHLPLTLRENHWVTQEQFFPQKGSPFHATPIEESFDQEFRKRLNTIIENSPLFQ